MATLRSGAFLRDIGSFQTETDTLLLEYPNIDMGLSCRVCSDRGLAFPQRWALGYSEAIRRLPWPGRLSRFGRPSLGLSAVLGP